MPQKPKTSGRPHLKSVRTRQKKNATSNLRVTVRRLAIACYALIAIAVLLSAAGAFGLFELQLNWGYSVEYSAQRFQVVTTLVDHDSPIGMVRQSSSHSGVVSPQELIGGLCLAGAVLLAALNKCILGSGIDRFLGFAISAPVMALAFGFVGGRLASVWSGFLQFTLTERVASLAIVDAKGTDSVALSTWIVGAVLSAITSAVALLSPLSAPASQGDLTPVCSQCGYSLRGSLSTLCPECGTSNAL